MMDDECISTRLEVGHPERFPDVRKTFLPLLLSTFSRRQQNGLLDNDKVR